MDLLKVAKKLHKIARELELDEGKANEANTQFSKQLPQFLMELRKLEGLTLRELSKISGVSNPYLSLLENGANQPTTGVLNKILAVYGLTLAIVPIGENNEQRD